MKTDKPIRTHAEMQKMTLTENPLVMFQTRNSESHNEIIENLRGIVDESHDEAAVNSAKLSLEALDDLNDWRTERIFIDPSESDAFVECQRHRYPEDQKNKSWRIYTGIADGLLKKVVKEARDAANA